ncbi:serine hydrolase domain-containing protein [Candidatus Contubernalis alkaliaceticus]|uniref:serine hydrolase domain-containing protein n=1 Tax=Candidatus Contubernalis alkaliaceticus TaxID=338645 RepID=UPI001F4BDFA2|nr:serine hydrolase domain-containing protein [Candidatus Contubernalis alkalaceticus]UNC92320.1 beta-lactamase family protein [Candidatus Contubernalis alkalaceticus]
MFSIEMLEHKPFDYEEFEEFIDTFFEEKMKEYHVPGAAFVLVKDGSTFISKGYGYADLESNIPVEVDKTLFRVASVSKTFTILGVLQLAERGLVDLDKNVDTYLKSLKINNSSNEPVMVSHLLTHTDGFETRDLNTFSYTSDQMNPLGQLLKRELKSPVQKPGSMVTYGGYGTALAGFLVEELSRESFEDYIEKNVFEPLSMNRSSFYQVLPDNLASDVATTYYYDDKKHAYNPIEFLYVNTPPTGGASTTAMDMARFISAILSKEKENHNTQFLSGLTVEKMFSRQYAAHPALPGVTYGFMEHFYNNQRGLIRDGSGLGIRSQIYLLPEHNIGYFFVQNSRGDRLINDFNKAFLKRYFTAKDKDITKDNQIIIEGLEKFNGVYRPVQTAEHTLVKLEALVMGEIRVREDKGRLTIKPMGMGDVYGGFDEVTQWEQIEQYLFRQKDDEAYLAFGTDETGRINYLFSGSGYHGSYYRIPWYETAKVQLVVLGLLVSIFLLNIILWPIRIIKKDKANVRCSIKKPLQYAGWSAFVISLLNISGLTLLLYELFIKQIAGLPAFAFGVSSLAKVMLGLLIITMVVSGVFFIALLAGLIKRRYMIRECVYLLGTAVGFIVFYLWLDYWNILGFKY